jgi:hypothetical protein
MQASAAAKTDIPQVPDTPNETLTKLFADWAQVKIAFDDELSLLVEVGVPVQPVTPVKYATDTVEVDVQ